MIGKLWRALFGKHSLLEISVWAISISIVYWLNSFNGNGLAALPKGFSFLDYSFSIGLNLALISAFFCLYGVYYEEGRRLPSFSFSRIPLSLLTLLGTSAIFVLIPFDQLAAWMDSLSLFALAGLLLIIIFTFLPVCDVMALVLRGDWLSYRFPKAAKLWSSALRASVFSAYAGLIGAGFALYLVPPEAAAQNTLHGEALHIAKIALSESWDFAWKYL